MGTLYLVATPIGNMEDITLRALRVLGEAALVLAEDTRTTRRLLSRHGISRKVVSYNEHNMNERTPGILKELESGDVALVSEAGTPAISDPGYELVLAAIEAGIEVSPVPGPSAVIAALAASGLPTQPFTFLGFLPRRRGGRTRLLKTVTRSPETLVAFESPHRVQASLESVLATLGDRRIAVCRELTKIHEEIFRGRVSEAIQQFEEPRGEFTLVIEGAPPPAPADDEDVREQLRGLRTAGMPAKEAVTRVARESGRPRREVYRIWLELG